jgi:Uma2 family endonuclease
MQVLIAEESVLKMPDMTDDLQTKMQEWMVNGCALAWLIDPYERIVYVYTPRGHTELNSPETLQGEGPVEGFTLHLATIWNPFN